MSAKTESFVPIDIASLIRQCDEWAERCVGKGDVLPPASAFKPSGREWTFFAFDAGIMQKYGQIRHKVSQIVYDGATLPQSLDNLFAVRCMALLAKQLIKLSFVYDWNTTKSIFFALDERSAFYWALTYFWQSSGRGFRKAIWDEEIFRLESRHDTSLLPNCWTRGKVGDELRLEMAEKRTRAARAELEQCEKDVAELRQRTLKKPIRKKPS